MFGSPPVEARSRTSYVLQATKVNGALPVTVREVVTMGRFASLGTVRRFGAADRTAVETAMEQTEISDLARRQLGELSGGQRQRVFVAQGLAQDHDLLLLDEPLTGLDLVSMQIVLGVLRRASRRSHRDHDHTRPRRCLGGRPRHPAGWAGHSRRPAGGGADRRPPERRLRPSHRRMEGRIMVDDPAHQPAERWHVHLDSSKRRGPRN